MFLAARSPDADQGIGTSGDRAAYLSAVELFHRLDLDAGRRTYGHKWTNAKTSVVKHLARMTMPNLQREAMFAVINWNANGG